MGKTPKRKKENRLKTIDEEPARAEYRVQRHTSGHGGSRDKESHQEG